MVTCFLAPSPLGVWVSWVLVTSSLSLSAKEINYSEVNFLTPPPPPSSLHGHRRWASLQISCKLTILGTISQGCKSLMPKFSFARLIPSQRRVFDKNVQTIDPNPDTTLTEIDASVLTEDSDMVSQDSKSKKRKCM